MTLRAIARGPAPTQPPYGTAGLGAPASAEPREAYFGPELGWLGTPVLGRAAVGEGTQVVPYLNRLSSLLWVQARWVEGEHLLSRDVPPET